MQILNKTTNMRNDICYRVSSNGRICELNKEQLENFVAPFELLSKEDKSISNVEDLGKANALAREKVRTRIRRLENEQAIRRNAGFALISSVTIVGILVMGLIIFMAIKVIMFR